MREACGAAASVGVDRVLAPVGDDVDLPLPLGHLGRSHHQALLVHGVEAALGITRVEDGVVHIILLLAAHGSDGGVGDLAGKHPVPVLVIDGGKFPVNLTNENESGSNRLKKM